MTYQILALLEKHANAEQVSACLVKNGYEVFVAENFESAIDVLSSQKISLIISDVHLENGGNVFDFLRRVKKDETTSQIPFILYSLQPTPIAKYLADGVRTAARTLGATTYIEMELFDSAAFGVQVENALLQKTNIVTLEQKSGE